MRPDESVIGTDPGAGKDETVIQVPEGCIRCHRKWPEVRFSKLAEVIQRGDINAPAQEILCDRCWESNDPELDKAIAEAAGVQTTPALIRSVEVTGIQSKTNVVSFKYATHIGEKELVTTLLNVAFKGKVPGELTWYVYRNVPVAVCEAWFAAPSKGSYFASLIKNSYDAEKKA